MESDLIVALASPLGRAAVAIIRLDGDELKNYLLKLFPELKKTLQPRRATHCWLRISERLSVECLLTFFEHPHSYTGNDLAELSVHSNPLLIEELLRFFLQRGCRLARPGEFTLRALQNEKLDLLQAEAVNELIQADSLAQIEKQEENLQGKLSSRLTELYQELSTLLSHTEFELEFAENESNGPSLEAELKAFHNKLEEILKKNRLFQSWQQKLKVVIAGLVNSGKSCLFNALLDQQRAIVSEHPGTTRDYLEAELNIQGIPLKLVDIAGFDQQTTDELELEGIRRSWEQIQQADNLIYLIDASRPPAEADREILKKLANRKKLILLNKADIVGKDELSRLQKVYKTPDRQVISAKTGQNLEVIFEYLHQSFRVDCEPEDLLLLNLRQQQLLSQIVELFRQINQTELFRQPELLAEELRKAISFFDELCGRTSSDDILNKIFSNFCVGK